jgi:thiamine biosynthesis protein ThiI
MPTKIMKNTIIVKYGELFLKSEFVRKQMARVLADNIKSSLKKKKIKAKLTRNRDFIEISADKKAVQKTKEILGKTFGISNFAEAVVCKKDLKEIIKISKRLSKYFKGKTFAIRTRRSDKKFPYTSQEINHKVGWEITGYKADLENPYNEIFIEIRDNVYVYSKIEKGPGGMPFGTAGKFVVLLSGGIDSAVAAWMLMKRGAKPVFVYCDNTPYTGKLALKKAKDVISRLSEYSPIKQKVYIIKHGKNLKAFQKCDNHLSCVLCKRMMFRIAEKIAEKENARGMVTGSSLAQVASQTAHNLFASHYGLKYPVYHPLIGFDKMETEKLARQIGTYEKSIAKAERCSFVPKNPATAADIKKIIKEERKIDIKKMAERSVKTAEVIFV